MRTVMSGSVTDNIERRFREHGLEPALHHHLIVSLMEFTYDWCNQELDWALGVSRKQHPAPERIADAIDQARDTRA